jgi:hypothetical protein
MMRSIARSFLLPFALIAMMAEATEVWAGKPTKQRTPPSRPVPATAGKKIACQWEGRFKGTYYYVIPYEIVYPKSYKKLLEMFESKFAFFYVIVDNKQGKEKVVFNPKQADFFVLLFNGRRTGVDLSNTLADPAQSKKISQEFKDMYVPIEVPPGEAKWTIFVMGYFALGDATQAYWSFPGENQKMKEKPLDPVDVRRYKLKPLPGTEDKPQRR